MSEITLLNIKLNLGSGNPFNDYPLLRDIWTDPLDKLAEEGVVESLEYKGRQDMGDIFLIMKDESVIGITGYYPYSYESDDTGQLLGYPDKLGLRWHGIIPEERNNGYSTEAFKQLIDAAGLRFPLATTLVELVPLTEVQAPISKYFSDLGFIAKGRSETYDWSDNAWQPYHLDMPDFKNNYFKQVRTKFNL